jgi:hypothetical protein
MNRIAIHHRTGSFSDCWIEYCNNNSIPYKIVNCYDTDIVNKLENCEILMWHYHHTNYKDALFAEQLLFSLESNGIKVFPNFNTSWHFDDKVGQKYLLEATDAPLVPSYVFYNNEEAKKWAKQTEFPKVFKLRSGSGSSHVKLVDNEKQALKLIKQAFKKGFSQYDPAPNLRERWRKFKHGKTGFFDLIKGIIRFGYTTDFNRYIGNEKGYVYFQDFIPNNDSDIRIIVINGKAFAIKRLVRENDFRASGSGFIEYEKELFESETINLSFLISDKLKTQSLAIDYVYDHGTPKIVELSFGYTKQVYERCEGYWDRDLNWHEGPFNPQHWMIESIINEVKIS